jgi:hypothetical protein
MTRLNRPASMRLIALMLGYFLTFGTAEVRADAHVVVIFNLQAPAAAATDGAILAHELAVQVNAADGYEARIRVSISTRG